MIANHLPIQASAFLRQKFAKYVVGQVHFQSTCPEATELKRYISGSVLASYLKQYSISYTIVFHLYLVKNTQGIVFLHEID